MFNYEMKLKSAAIFTGIYLIRYDIVHLASARDRVSFSIQANQWSSVMVASKIVQMYGW